MVPGIKKKSTLFRIVYVLISTIALFTLLETTCLVVNRMTNGRRCASMKNSTYPSSNAEQYLKIAVVGGSAAAGLNAERSFVDFMEYELKRNLSGPVYVKNFAASGYPFHRYEAEIIKNVIEDYDIFLIYEGNNEATNYIDDSGYFRKEEFKNARELRPLPDSQKDSLLHPIQFLANNS
ncbi:MAG: hypothetical protein ACRD4B_05270, partial [Acidobacteriota bacterium]